MKTNPYNGEYWERLGLACYNLKDYPAAIEAYKKQLPGDYQDNIDPVMNAIFDYIDNLEKKKVDHP